MGKYYVTFKVDARYTVEVDAAEGSMEEVKKKAQEKYMGANFGELHDVVSGEAVTVENEAGDIVWEK